MAATATAAVHASNSSNSGSSNNNNKSSSKGKSGGKKNICNICANGHWQALRQFNSRQATVGRQQGSVAGSVARSNCNSSSRRVQWPREATAAGDNNISFDVSNASNVVVALAHVLKRVKEEEAR